MTSNHRLCATFLVALICISVPVHCSIYKLMAEAMLYGLTGGGGGGHGGWNEGWESKGVTFGLKSKGMTAIIPFPLPIPFFSKDKKEEKVKYVPVPVHHGHGGGEKEDWWK